jgi:hypothetical protein
MFVPLMMWENKVITEAANDEFLTYIPRPVRIRVLTLAFSLRSICKSPFLFFFVFHLFFAVLLRQGGKFIDRLLKTQLRTGIWTGKHHSLLLH